MTKLEVVDLAAVLRLAGLGLVIYFVYGRTHSRLQRGEGPDEDRAEIAV